jgi:2-desacetyl-2-hydroxyethyl bacteriochlorophyllide A dehydrogenase
VPDLTGLALTSPWVLESQAIPRPAPGPGDVVVRASFVGICGTDMALIRGSYRRGTYPLLLGHEWVGCVVGAGPGADPALLGQMVVGENLVEPAREGRHSIEIGFERPGGLAEEFVIPARLVRPLGADIHPSDAVLVEPTSVAAHVLHRLGNMRGGESVAVVGDGPIGLLVALLAGAAGYPVTMLGASPSRLATASAAGIETFHVSESGQDSETGFPAVVEASGTRRGLKTATELCQPGGVIALTGTYPPATELDAVLVMHGNMRIEGVDTGVGFLEQAVDAISRGVVSLDRLGAKVVPEVDAVREIVEQARNPTTLKLVVDKNSRDAATRN